MSSQNTVVTPPVFELFSDGTLLAYDAIEEIALTGTSPLEDLRAWDSLGQRIVLTFNELNHLTVAEVSNAASDRDDLERLLIERLKKGNVMNVDAASFEDLVYKASIRMVAPRASNAGLVAGLLDVMFQFLRRP